MNKVIKIVVDESSFRRVELWTTEDSGSIALHYFEITPQSEGIFQYIGRGRMSKKEWENIAKAYNKYAKIIKDK